MNIDRWKSGGDKYESTKADEAWEKSHPAIEYFICDGCCQPKETTDICVDDKSHHLLCFECFDEQEKAVIPNEQSN